MQRTSKKSLTSSHLNYRRQKENYGLQAVSYTHLLMSASRSPDVLQTTGDLLADIKEAFDSGDATEYEILKAYKTVDLLIVDDLGKRCV